MGIRKKMLIELTTKDMMDFLNKFDKDRTIGSIKRKEVKSIVEKKLEKIDLDKLLKAFK